MPHIFVNRPRIHNLTRDRSDLRAQFRWETLNAVFYKAGGITFIVGSLFFFPYFEAYADIGAWTFFAGSLLYLVVTVHDLAEVHRHWHKARGHCRSMVLEYTAAAGYVGGTVLFTVGSIFFLSTIGWLTIGAWCFIFGSLQFVLAACINVVQIIRADSLITLQLMNWTAVAFVVGSVLFTVASIPYLWNLAPSPLQTTLYAFLAWQYLVGSILFLLGGLFNYWRAYLVAHGETNGSRVDSESLK